MAGKEAWAVRFEGKEPFDLRDLPVGRIDEIAKDNDSNWWTVIGAPLSDFGIAEGVIRAVADWHGDVTVPDPLTPRNMEPLFTTVTDDLPDAAAVDGDPPTGAAT